MHRGGIYYRDHCSECFGILVREKAGAWDQRVDSGGPGGNCWRPDPKSRVKSMAIAAGSPGRDGGREGRASNTWMSSSQSPWLCPYGRCKSSSGGVRPGKPGCAGSCE